MALDMIIDALLQRGLLLPKKGQALVQRIEHRLRGETDLRLLQAIGLPLQIGLYRLQPTEQRLKRHDLWSGRLPQRRFHARPVARQYHPIAGVRFATHRQAPGKLTHPRRVDHRDLRTGLRERIGRRLVIDPGGLHHHVQLCYAAARLPARPLDQSQASRLVIHPHLAAQLQRLAT